MKDVLKSRGLWVAVFALLGMILMDTIPNFNAGRYQQYVDAILLVLAAGGLVPVGQKLTKNTKSSQDE
ncbi:hypothetical protein FOT98_09060 [Bacillus sp. HY001]|uniref:hypothetical protein n=1 Tax=Bacillus TaxID=1386 RepID=UPI0011854442|nr:MULTISPECIES: hypothetical protein [Bacillus]TSI19930.1 hypothetical protein FOT98_09060 [Bacillus sp. HY001]